MSGAEALRQRARRILDDVRGGIYHSLQVVNWALRICGDFGDCT